MQCRAAYFHECTQKVIFLSSETFTINTSPSYASHQYALHASVYTDVSSCQTYYHIWSTNSFLKSQASHERYPLWLSKRYYPGRWGISVVSAIHCSVSGRRRLVVYYKNDDSSFHSLALRLGTRLSTAMLQVVLSSLYLVFMLAHTQYGSILISGKLIASI